MPVASSSIPRHASHDVPPNFGTKRSNDSFFFFKKSDHILHKIVVVSRELFVGLAGLSFFALNPILFVPCFIAGAVLQPVLVKLKFFDTLKKIFYLEPVVMSIILILGGILAYPTSGWIACGYTAFWLGKHVADIALSKDLFPGYTMRRHREASI